MKIFRIADYGTPVIEEMEVEGITAHFVKLKPDSHKRSRREAIESSFHFYSPTREGAKEWFVKRMKNKVEGVMGSLNYWENKLIEALKL